MTLRRLSILQWLGLLLGAGVWFAQHVVGFGITQAECGAGGRGWGISHDTWQAVLMAIAAALVLSAEAAALGVVFGTRDASYEAEAPAGRIRFFAIAAVAANLIFLTIILLDGFATLFNTVCRQA
jgi:hypothetical protein